MMAYKDMFVVVVKCEGKILRERDGIITMPFRSEYSILMKNKNARKALVSIDIDGEDVLDGHELIVKPNSDLELEGFIKGTCTTNKFKFIQKTEQITEHLGDKIDDGLIRIKFTYEKKVVSEKRLLNEHIKSVSDHQVKTYEPWFSSSGLQYKSFSGDTNDGSRGLSNSSTPKATSNVVMDSLDVTPQQDEGITVKGSESNQRFNYGEIGELEESSSAIVLKLRGIVKHGEQTVQVQKPITVKTKLECPTCGDKSNSTAKFCSNCGTALF